MRSTVARTRSTSAACVYWASITVPPVNSIDRCRPRVVRKNTAAAKVMNEIALKTNAWRMNGMSRRILKNSISMPLSWEFSVKAHMREAHVMPEPKTPSLCSCRAQAFVAGSPS